MDEKKYVIAINDPLFIRRNAPDFADLQRIYVKSYNLRFPSEISLDLVAKSLASIPLGNAYNFLSEIGAEEFQSYSSNPSDAKIFYDNPKFKLDVGFFVEFMRRSMKHPPSLESFLIEELS